MERWRAEALMRAGYDPGAAHDLATRLDIDLHTATELLERGCPADLAAQHPSLTADRNTAEWRR